MSNVECTKDRVSEMRVFSPSMLRSPSPRNCSIRRPWAALATSAAIFWSIPCTSGCAPTLPPPTERLTSTEARVEAAEKDGADKTPAAKEVLSRARAGVDRAKRALKQGKHNEAEELLLRAGADAELADALAREGESADAVKKAKAVLAEEEKGK